MTMEILPSAGVMRPPVPMRDDMDAKIGAAFEAGEISEVDAAALETALESIDSSLATSTGTANDAAGRLDPELVKDRIEALIAEQVEQGTLSEEQAGELQALFAQGPSRAGGNPPPPPPVDGLASAGVEGLDSVGLREPPPPPPPPVAIEGGAQEESAASAQDTSETSDAVLAAMQAFLDNLRASLAQGTTYTTSATSETASSASGLIVDQLV